jgi:hypothetical protein
MLRSRIIFCLVALCGFSLPVMAQADCKSYYSLAPLDQDILKLIATQSVPANQASFAPPGYTQLRDWDFPSKVAAWQQRPSANELTKRWDEVTKKWTPAMQDGKGGFRPYGLLALPASDWKDLQKWFAKEGPKKISGMCSDPTKTNYVLAVGVISDRAGNSAVDNAAARNEYQQYSGARQQDRNYGPNAAVESPTAHVSTTQELSGMGSDDLGPGTYTCVFLFRATGTTRQATPDFYYCKSSGEVPKSAVATMLKYLATK